MDEDERTLVWRRPPAGSAVHETDTETIGGRRREPVQVNDPAVNVNQPSSGYGYRPVVGPTATQLAVWRTQRVIYYIFGVIEAFIAIRFILKLLAANPDSAFTQVIYNISWVFVFPFNNVVPNTTSGGSTFEWFSIIAIVVYSLVSMGLAKLISLVL
jgi:hypothetical protein